MKVTSGSTPEIAAVIDDLYASIITAGTFRAASIRVAEAAKVIENTQRDVNIALINELAVIFEKVGIDTEAVLAGCWNKMEFFTISAGACWRALYRCGSLLFDTQSRAAWAQPRNYSSGAPN